MLQCPQHVCMTCTNSQQVDCWSENPSASIWTTLCFPLQDVHGDVQLFSVYVPTNHIYVGDVFMLGKQDIIKVNLSVREGLGEQSQSPCLQIGHITLVLSLRTDPTYSNPFAWTLATWPETCVHLHHCSHCILRLEFVVLLSLLRFLKCDWHQLMGELQKSLYQLAWRYLRTWCLSSDENLLNRWHNTAAVPRESCCWAVSADIKQSFLAFVRWMLTAYVHGNFCLGIW